VSDSAETDVANLRKHTETHQNNHLDQRDPTGGPRATSGPSSLATRPAKLFVNLLQLL
jgi:hypothetical protein